jgi:CheY-like chemotaxis protein
MCSLPAADIAMPNCDGHEATRRIRALEAAEPHRRPTHIIALTAHASAEDEAEALRSGMDQFATKPASLAVFLKLLLNAVSLSSALPT